MSAGPENEIKRLLSGERHLRPLGSDKDMSVCLAYPNSYRVGAASLGFQVVRRLLSDSGCSVERIFLSGRDKKAARRRLLRSWESDTPVSRFDVLAFSLPFELDAINLVRLVLQSGLPAPAGERNQSHPLVIAGGAAVSINPEPLAPFLDAVVLGESEAIIPALVENLRGFSGQRSALLQRLARLDGVYVPALQSAPPPLAARPELGAAPPAISDFISPDSEFADTVLIEVGRGCSMGCRFCWAGWSCRPLRAYDAQRVLDAVDQLPVDLERFGLIATSLYDHAAFEKLLRGLRERGKRVTVSALRVDHVNAGLLEHLRAGGARSISIAPEAGNEELRRRVGKAVSDRQVVEAAEAVAAAGLRALKMYFLVGLPGENDQDVADIASLVSSVAAGAPALQLSISLNVFVPKPGSPFGDRPLCDPATLRRRLNMLREGMRQIPSVEVETMAPWQAAIQALLSRGGREVSTYILEAARRGMTLRQLYSSIPDGLLESVVFSRQQE